MEKSVRVLATVLLSTVALLLPAGPVEAQRPRGIGRAPLSPAALPPNPMFGWDWWRTYPWSPYNYGRNPYNPAVVPYPYVVPYRYPIYYPYPIYNPYPEYYGGGSLPLGSTRDRMSK